MLKGARVTECPKLLSSRQILGKISQPKDKFSFTFTIKQSFAWVSFFL